MSTCAELFFFEFHLGRADAFAQGLGEFCAAEFLALFGGDGASVPDGDGVASDVSVSRPGLVGAFDGGGDDGHVGAVGEAEDAGHEGAHAAVGGAGAFGKEDEAGAVLESADGFADGVSVHAVTTDGKGVESANERAEERIVKERASGHERAMSRQGEGKQRRIEVALMVGGDEDAAAVRHVCEAEYSQAEAGEKQDPAGGSSQEPKQLPSDQADILGCVSIQLARQLARLGNEYCSRMGGYWQTGLLRRAGRQSQVGRSRGKRLGGHRGGATCYNYVTAFSGRTVVLRASWAKRLRAQGRRAV